MKIKQIDQAEAQYRKLLDTLFEQDDDALIDQESVLSEEVDSDDAREFGKALKGMDAEDEMQQFENAYEELRLLSRAMERGQFGLLIGKRGAKLDYNDILAIKREITDIFRNNKILADANIYQGKDGWERIRLVPQAIYSSLNKWGSFLISGILAWTSIGFFASVGVATLPIIALIGGTVLSGLFLAAGIKNHRINKSIKNAAKVLSILDAYEDMSETRPGDDRGAIRKFFDFLMMKSPRKIRREAQEKVETSAREAAERFEELTENLPETVTYYERDGTPQEYPTVELFTG